jgi:hypothetical protein
LCYNLPMLHEVLREHYYGDAIRVIFIVSGLAMLLTLPFFSPILKIPIFLPIITVLALAILGGFLNPRQFWIIITNVLVSLFACATFQYYAITAYLYLSPAFAINVAFFWTNQILAVLFFIALYLSVKTLRGKILTKDKFISKPE